MGWRFFYAPHRLLSHIRRNIHGKKTMNKKIIGLAVLVAVGFAYCQFMKQKQNSESMPLSSTPRALPQNPPLQIYFNQSIASSYTEPYREQTRNGDDLEAQIVKSINSARSSVGVAVAELRLPRIARALAHRHRSGIKVRLVVEHLYHRPLAKPSERSAQSAPQLAVLPKREQERYAELLQLADANKDGELRDAEISSGDALAIVRSAGIPVIVDTADGSKGS